MTKGQLKGIEICGEYHDASHITRVNIEHGYVTVEAFEEHKSIALDVVNVRLCDRFDRVRFYIDGPDNSN